MLWLLVRAVLRILGEVKDEDGAGLKQCKGVCSPTGMFARKAVAQSLAREFGPQGIHVSHVIIDGTIDTPGIREHMGEDKDEKVSVGKREDGSSADNYSASILTISQK